MSDQNGPFAPPPPPPGFTGATTAAVNENASQEKADKKRKSRVELAGAIIIGIAAVLTAIATFQGSQVDGTVQDKSTEAVGLTLQANDLYNDANAFRAEERAWFFGYITAEANEQSFTASLLRRAMPLEVQALTGEWFDKNQARIGNEEPIDDPFNPGGDFYETFELLPSVVNLSAGNMRKQDAACALFDSEVAGSKGDSYGLSTVYLAIALVVGGIAALLNGKAAQLIVLTTATLSLLIGAGVLAFAGDAAEARADNAAEFFPFDANGNPLSREGSLAEADTFCPQEPETAASTVESDAEATAPATAAGTAATPGTDSAPATTTPPETTAAAPAHTNVPPEDTAPALPPNDFVPIQGGDAVAVYLDILGQSATSGNLGDDFAVAIDAGESLGFDVAYGDIGCDEGAAEQLKLEDGDLAASVYFATFEDADAFAAAYPFPVVGIVEVRTFCLD